MSADALDADHPARSGGPGFDLEQAMREALDQARQAIVHGDVPVGAVVVRDGVVIASRHNERELSGDPTAHAEILALRDAAATIGHWRLDDCTLVVTLEPCVMCAGAIVNSRLGHLVYGAADPKAGAAGSCFDLVDHPLLNHRISRTTGVLEADCGRLLVDFFVARRRSQ
jgi:tRNA(adenine34) deaminase